MVATVVRRQLAAAPGNLGGDLEEDLAERILLTHQGRVRRVAARHARSRDGLGVVNEIHDDGTGAVSAGVLRKVIGARELLAAVVALKRLLLGVKRAVVALEVLLAAEPAVADIADKGLGGILRQGLLAPATASGSRQWSRTGILRPRVVLGFVLGFSGIAAGATLVAGRRPALGASRLGLGRAVHGGLSRLLALIPVGLAVVA